MFLGRKTLKINHLIVSRQPLLTSFNHLYMSLRSLIHVLEGLENIQLLFIYLIWYTYIICLYICGYKLDI